MSIRTAFLVGLVLAGAVAAGFEAVAGPAVWATADVARAARTTNASGMRVRVFLRSSNGLPVLGFVRSATQEPQRLASLPPFPEALGARHAPMQNLMFAATAAAMFVDLGLVLARDAIRARQARERASANLSRRMSPW